MGYNCTMKNTHQLTKKEAEALFGGPEAVSKALGYTSASTVYNWPQLLSESVSDRVRGAAWRLGLIAAPAETSGATPPAPRQVKRRGWCLRGGRSA